ncbi:MAG TPA: alpha-glucan family phosphorylase [Acidobacteriota bacterium]|nr:alpha-glucan family phosphorylase [Acidobacteriota bacterium]
MEIGLEEQVPTYSGGLGILAGDTIRAAADLKVPILAVSLLDRNGYFYQRLDTSGNQIEEPVHWPINDFLVELPQRCKVAIEGRDVQLRCWKYEVKGISNYVVPVYFLDSNLPENSEWDRRLTDQLYGGDERYRLSQEIILGIGGIKMLRALGYTSLTRYHMNEGHASLLAIELLEEEARESGREIPNIEDVRKVRELCIFTTHTPVEAGFDKFDLDLVNPILNKPWIEALKDVFCCENQLNMTYIGLNLSHYVNGVAKKHGETARSMFGRYDLDSITNGVHGTSWVSPSLQQLFDEYIPGWRQDNFGLRHALSIPKNKIWEAHLQSKKNLIHFINDESNAGMDIDFFTIGFARRFTAYKRPDLLFHDLDRLLSIVEKCGPIQLVYAGKAHPHDEQGKKLIQSIFQASQVLKDHLRLAFLPNYDMGLARLLTSGVDLWLNTPKPPNEASGTSGMKAAMNGVPSLSILDGWWIEGHIEDVTGWSIGENNRRTSQIPNNSEDAMLLYDKLSEIIPIFYKDQQHYIDIMKHAIALNGSYFNTHRMIQQYVLNAYFI